MMKNPLLLSAFTFILLTVTSGVHALTPEESVREISDHLPSLKPITWTSAAQKHHLVVFIDNQCVYCSDVVKNVHKYTDAGLTLSFITVAPPTIRDQVVSDMARVWCSAEPHESLRKAMAGFLPENDSTPDCVNTIEAQSALASRVGVQATPVMVVLQPEPVVFLGNVKPADILKKLKP